LSALCVLDPLCIHITLCHEPLNEIDREYDLYQATRSLPLHATPPRLTNHGCPFFNFLCSSASLSLRGLSFPSGAQINAILGY